MSPNREREARGRALAESASMGAPTHGSIAYVRSLPFGHGAWIDEYRMENGLELLILLDTSAPVVAYHTWFRVGSRHEIPGKTGLAHLFEHLMFNEIEGLEPGTFDVEMEAAGADNNASTWLDFTQYQEAFPRRHLPMVIDLESRRMNQLVVRQPQLDCEKDVVKNERRERVEDDVDGLAEELLYKTAFLRHPYQWPTIGWMEDIEGFTLKDTSEFYRKYYSPNNASLIVVGDLDEEATLRLLSRHYGDIAPSSIPTHRAAPEPEQTEERRARLVQPTSTEKLFIGYKGPAIDDEDHVAANLLVEILTGGNASRLHRRLVREEKLASEISGFVGPHVDPGLIEFSLSLRSRNSALRATEVFDEEMTALRTKPVSNDELLRGKRRMELALRSGLQTADGKAASIGFYQCVLRRPAGALERLEQLERVQAPDILRVAGRFLESRKRTVVTLLTNDELMHEVSPRVSEAPRT